MMHRLRRAVRPLRIVPGILLLLGAASGSPCLASKKPDAGAGGEWPEITQAERALTKVEQDPEADAVVLINNRTGKIAPMSNGEWVNQLTYHWRLKVLTERGKGHGEVTLGADKYSRVSNLRARTIKTDGTIVPVTPDQIFEKVVLQVGKYKLTETVFKFPAVEPGAILEYHYDRFNNNLVYITPWFFAGDEFTVRSRLTQTVPGGTAYTVLCDLCGDAKPEINDSNEGGVKGMTYSMELRNLPGYRREEFMPPARDVTPRMEMIMQSLKNHYWEELKRRDSLFTDWASVAKYTSYFYQRAIKNGQQALKPVVDGWTQGVSDPQQKISAITGHVLRDFRLAKLDYVDLYPDPFDSLLKDKVATNGEKAVLLIAALKQIGVDSYAALVSGKQGGSLNPKFVSPSQFTHTVVALPSPDGTYQWIDPSESYASFGFMPWFDAGADALLLKGEQGELMTLPAKNELSTSRYKVTVKPRPDGKADIEAELEFTGQDAVDMRDDLVPASESDRTAYIKDWLSERRSGAVLQSQAIEDLDDVNKPIRIKVTFEAPDLVTKAEDLLIVRGCVLTCLDSNPISKGKRQNPVYVDRGWNRDETVVVVPPAGMAAAQMPPPASARSVIGTYMLSCNSAGEGGARCSRQFVARRNRWDFDQFSNVHTMYDKIVEGDRTTVAIQKVAASAGGH